MALVAGKSLVKTFVKLTVACHGAIQALETHFCNKTLYENHNVFSICNIIYFNLSEEGF